MTGSISKSERFAGTVQLPADESTAHRAALFASIVNGVSTLHHFPSSAVPQSTLSCLRQLGLLSQEVGAFLMSYGSFAFVVHAPIGRLPLVVSDLLLVKPDMRISRIRLSVDLMTSPTEGLWSLLQGGAIHRSPIDVHLRSAHISQFAPFTCDKSTAVTA